LDSPVLIPASPFSPFSPSVRFCARNASQKIKDVEGYVSFGTIEGLGMPEEMIDEHAFQLDALEEVPQIPPEKEQPKSSSWTPRWLTKWKV